MTFFVESGPIIGYCSYFEVVPSEDLSNDDLDPHAELGNKFFSEFTDNVSSNVVFDKDIPDFLNRRTKSINLVIRRLLRKRIRPTDTSGLIERDLMWVRKMYSKLNKNYYDSGKSVYTLREITAKFNVNLAFCKKNFFKEIVSTPLDNRILSCLNYESVLHEKDKRIICHALQYHNRIEEIEIVTCEKNWCVLTFEKLKWLKLPKITYLGNVNFI